VTEHCPGCLGYTAGWEDPCPGLPAPEAPPGRSPALDKAGHATFLGEIALPGLCHCRIGRPHDVGDVAGYDQEHDRADGAGPARPRP
jgi:hypothetical protein